MFKYIQLNLFSQFTSFGGSTSTAERVSDNVPSRSLIEGILSCVFGIKRNDYDKLNKIHENLLEYGVCIKNLGNKLSDFQIIQKSRTCESVRKGTIELKKEKNTKKNASTIANKEYYTDNYCIVLLKIKEVFIDDVIKHLNNPIWQPYLGRKCNTLYKYFYDNNEKSYKKWFEIFESNDTIQDIFMKQEGTIILESEPVDIPYLKKTIRGIRNFSLKDRFFNEQNLYIVKNINNSWEKLFGEEK